MALFFCALPVRPRRPLSRIGGSCRAMHPNLEKEWQAAATSPTGRMASKSKETAPLSL
ncbi:hypothetical protein [Azospirillum palustre]